MKDTSTHATCKECGIRTATEQDGLCDVCRHKKHVDMVADKRAREAVDMARAVSEKVLGVMRARRVEKREICDEALFFTPGRVIVAETASSSIGGSGALFGAVGVLIEAGIETYRGRDARAQKEKEIHELSADRELSAADVLKARRYSFVLPNAKITEVELKKRRLGVPKLKVIAKDYRWGEKFEWNLVGLLPKKKGVKLEDYENILRPAFGDKLSVKK